MSLLVLLQVVLSTKSCTAHFTDEWFILAVARNVFFQVPRLRECLPAVVAHKAFVARVDPHVLVQVGRGLESRVARVAGVGSGGTVRALVLPEVGGDSKGLTALPADMLLDPRVLEHVDSEVFGPGKNRCTLLANVTTLLGVLSCCWFVVFVHGHLNPAITVPSPDMFFEVAGLHESPAAELTFKAFITRVDPSVLGKVGGGRESSPALFADIRPVPSVGSDVGFQVPWFREARLAELAVKQFVTVVGRVGFQFQQRCEKLATFHADMGTITVHHATAAC